MKKQAFLITVVVTMIIGFVRPGWTQEINAGGRDEVNAHKRLEGNHSNTIKDLKKKYPNANFSDARWLKNHPDAARKLYKDKKFLRKHPDIAKRIHSGNITADRREDIRDRREDVRDRRHGFRDRRKDIRGRRNEVTKADRLRKSGRGIKHHKHEIRDNKRDIRKKRRTTGQEIGQRRVHGNVPKGARMQSSGGRNRR
jgi:hypothetical protein